MEALRAATSKPNPPVEADLAPRHGELTVPEHELAFWSTHLGITVEDRGDDWRTARVLGIFSPHPEIWTAYVFTIGFLIVAGVFGVMVAIVQLAMGSTPWALVVSLIAALVGGLVYTTTLVGQGLAADEMYRLRSFLDDCLASAESRARQEPSTASDSAFL